MSMVQKISVRGRSLVCLLLLVGVLSACGSTGNTTGNAAGDNTTQQVDAEPKSQVTLTISAAASLKDSMEELASLYKKEHGNVTLTMNFGASGSLQKQIEQGAPADLFLSAGQKQMNALIDGKFVNADSKIDLLQNRLVLIVPSDAAIVPKDLEALKDNGFGKIALGEPEVVPAGSYTKESLEYAQLWDALQSKMVFAKDVTQVLTYVESGNADAGFVYESDAKLSDKVNTALVVDEKSHAPIVYPAGIVTATKHLDEAGQFLKFLQTAEARDVFASHGFTVTE
ncbi:molybdate transport system substrate-binding protein [Fontibacillus phaseoli]|uniref:Molybdate transport system substrate-binding protein n=1 Tax=Fontibacillus phaseoli TaxID=1416533 RepID=A0A369B7D1_9BACL|nr:molybdate ABC transporter substrate-binding protein [Fontibacillus phaseoli]RCX17423.1 molybdate transport system substrate-binding protein [Fontibacillus phaseoli]